MADLEDKKKEKRFLTTQKMLEWQYFQIIGELQELQRHDSDPTCPCRLSDDLGENCLAKHSLGLSILAAETAAMETDKGNAKLLWTISEEAKEHHQQIKGFLCHKEDAPEFGDWSRQWRKKFEPIYYRTCSVKVKDSEGENDEQSQRPATLEDVTTDKIDSQLFGIKLAAAEFASACPEHSMERSFTGIKRDIDKRADSIDKIVEKLMARPTSDKPCPPSAPCPEGKAIPSGNTYAFGVTSKTHYTFEWKILDSKDILVSNDAITFAVNPKFPAVFQPRDRQRAGYQLRAQNRAAELDPDQLLVDTHEIGSSSPIVVPYEGKYLTLCGNGRIISMLIAAKEYPKHIVAYKVALKKKAPEYGLADTGIDKMAVPVLVRVPTFNMTKEQQIAFAQECNYSVQESAGEVEIAKADAAKITPEMLNGLIVLDTDKSINDSIRATRNSDFVRSFVKQLPENERNAVVDANGELSQAGVRRIATAIFSSFFRGERGAVIATKFFEATDSDVLTVFNGISRAMAGLAQAESLVASGARQKDYAFSEDLAKVIEVYSTIKQTDGMTVQKYINQQSFDRQLNPFQEKVLQTIADNARSGKRIGQILAAYSQLVIESTPPNQVSFMALEPLTKSELWDAAVKRATTVEVSDIAELFASKPPPEQMGFDFDARPYIEPAPFPTATHCPPICPIVEPITTGPAKVYKPFPFQADGIAWLKGRTFALLADDMGLGKTNQAIFWASDNLPALVVVPAAVVWNWHKEITTMWRVGDTALVLDGKMAVPEKLPQWTIVSYNGLEKYLPELKISAFKSLVIDEAHNIKNLAAQRTRNIIELVEPSEPEQLRRADLQGDKEEVKYLQQRIPLLKPIKNRLAVTGTPVLNRPIELFALLRFLGVKKQSDYRDFMEKYTEHKEVRGRLIWTGAKNLSELNKELQPFMLRRMKKDVLKDLPPKTNTAMFVPISNAREYREAETNFLSWLEKTKGSDAADRAVDAEVIVQMNSLRQLAAAGKVAPVNDWLKPCSMTGSKVLIFVQFYASTGRITSIKSAVRRTLYRLHFKRRTAAYR